MMFANYNNIFKNRARVLVEKTEDIEKQLFIYVSPKSNLKFPEKHLAKQKQIALEIAQECNYKPIIFEENYERFDDSFVFGEKLFELLVAVMNEETKNVFFWDLKITRNKYVTAFILHFLENRNVNLHTPNGIYSTPKDDYQTLSGAVNYLRDYSSFLSLFAEGLKHKQAKEELALN